MHAVRRRALVGCADWVVPWPRIVFQAADCGVTGFPAVGVGAVAAETGKTAVLPLPLQPVAANASAAMSGRNNAFMKSFT